MGIIGFLISLVAVLLLLAGFFPFLGWLNWFTTLPAAILGTVLCGIAARKKRPGGLAIAGLIISIAVFGIAILRLSIGGGLL